MYKHFDCIKLSSKQLYLNPDLRPWMVINLTRSPHIACQPANILTLKLNKTLKDLFLSFKSPISILKLSFSTHLWGIYNTTLYYFFRAHWLKFCINLSPYNTIVASTVLTKSGVPDDATKISEDSQGMNWIGNWYFNYLFRTVNGSNPYGRSWTY